jgi:hypothetical protein
MVVRAFAFAFLAALTAAVAAPAQAADPYAFCYADPPTYRSGTFVYTRVRFVSVGEIDLFEVGNALAATSPQVRGRQVSCWRYPSEQIAEAKRQEGMARDRSRGYTVVESEWQPSSVSNVAVPMPAPVALPSAPPPPAPATAASVPATITASPVADAPSQPTAELPPVSAPAAEANISADIDRAIGAPASAEPASAPVAAAPPPAPDPQTGAVANLNAGVVAAEAARLNAAAQVQADYQRQLAEHARQVAEIRARNEKAQADYQAAVKACAAGDFSKCGGPPVPVKKQD